MAKIIQQEHENTLAAILHGKFFAHTTSVWVDCIILEIEEKTSVKWQS